MNRMRSIGYKLTNAREEVAGGRGWRAPAAIRGLTKYWTGGVGKIPAEKFAVGQQLIDNVPSIFEDPAVGAPDEDLGYPLVDDE